MASQQNLKASDELLGSLLPPDFSPGKYDVICQRGKECFEHGKTILALFLDGTTNMKNNSPLFFQLGTDDSECVLIATWRSISTRRVGNKSQASCGVSSTIQPKQRRCLVEGLSVRYVHIAKFCQRTTSGTAKKTHN